MQDKHSNDGMELQRRALKPQSQRHLLERPALVDPVRHDLDEQQRHGNRGALEVLALAGAVLGQHGDGHVEAREPRQPAQHEEAQEEVVDWRAEAQAERCGGGGHAERDL